MMRYLALFAVLAASVSSILLYLYCRRERQKELCRMEALRSTKLYKHLHAALVSCRADSRDLDQVRIERDRITLTLVDPPHVLIQFDLHQAGFAKMSRVRTRVMAEVLAEDISIPHVKWIVVDASASFPRFDNAEKLAEKMGARYFRLEDLDADQFAEGVKAAIDQ